MSIIDKYLRHLQVNMNMIKLSIFYYITELTE